MNFYFQWEQIEEEKNIKQITIEVRQKWNVYLGPTKGRSAITNSWVYKQDHFELTQSSELMLMGHAP